MGALGLPFDEVWTLDFEFRTSSGGRPDVVCVVAHELGTGRRIRSWASELGAEPPFRTDANVLHVAYFASAEWSCFLQLGWPLPERILDLYLEFRVETNGMLLPVGSGLLGALSHHGLTGITKVEKQTWRDRIQAGPPYSEDERRGILDYCQSDVDALGPLLERMLPRITNGDKGLGRALLRGRYTRAVAHMERTGVPIDTTTLARLKEHWEGLKADLIAEVDADFGVYDGTTFRQWRFRDYLRREGIPWPVHESGALKLDADTFRDRAKAHPQLQPLKELRSSLSELRLASLAVGPDGRNRVMLSAFRARTGRNQPSTSEFVFGPAVWIRHLIVPPPGRALAYVDWKAQEVGIAAALSSDGHLQEAVQSGDPYLWFAKAAGLAPPEATKQSHPDIREMCKVALLGTNYGMQARLLSLQTGVSDIQAAELLRMLQRAFPRYSAWSKNNVDHAYLTGSIQTVLGWPLRVTTMSKPNSLLNFPMQANGAEMLRLACCLLTEAGIEVCAPVHDAVLIEADAQSIDETVVRTKALMEEASNAILDGFELATDVVVVRDAERYTDRRGQRMWDVVMRTLDARVAT